MEGTLLSKPHVYFQVEKVTGISSDGNYQVQWAPAWVSKFHLVGCEHLIQEFLQQQQQKQQQHHHLHQQQGDTTKGKELMSQSDSLEESGTMCTQVTGVHSLQDGSENLLPISNESSNRFLTICGAVPDISEEATVTETPVSCLEKTEADIDGCASGLEQHVLQTELTQFDEIDHCIKIEDDKEASDIDETLPLLDVVVEPTQSSYVQPIDQYNMDNHNSDSNADTGSHSIETCHQTTEKPLGSSNVVLETTIDETMMYSIIQQEVSMESESYETNSQSHQSNYCTKKKRFVCSVCKKPFPHRSNLLIHFRTHTGLRPYRCEVCDKTFTQSHHLKDHVRLHTNEKPYSCRGCSKTFKTTGNCNSHMSRCKSINWSSSVDQIP